MDQRLNEIAKVIGRDEILLQLAEELNDVKMCIELIESLIGGLQDKQKSYKEYKTDRWYKRTIFGQDKL